MDKGFIFSLDTGIATIIIIAMLFFFVSATSEQAQKKAENEKNIALWKNTLYFADTIIKNRAEENSVLGSAAKDAEKKRVKSNEIELMLLKKAEEIENTEFFLKEITVVFEDSEENIFFKKKGKNCVIVERLVLIENKKALLRIGGCNE